VVLQIPEMVVVITVNIVHLDVFRNGSDLVEGRPVFEKYTTGIPPPHIHYVTQQDKVGDGGVEKDLIQKLLE
jgi:hypothetical protein